MKLLSSHQLNNIAPPRPNATTAGAKDKAAVYISIPFILLILLQFLVTNSSCSPKLPNQRPPVRHKRSQHSRLSQQPTARGDLQASASSLRTPDGDGPTTPEDGAEQSVCGLPLLRLPKRVVPSHYDLMLVPNLTSFAFEGAVQIGVQVRKVATEGAKQVAVAANQIVLHADDSLAVDDIWYRDLGLGQEHDDNTTARQTNPAGLTNQSRANTTNEDERARYIDIVEVCRDPEYQLLVLNLARDLEPNSRGQLYLTFAGSFSEDLRGLYRSFAGASAKNEPKFLATTQFQAIEARRAFPCFDEPALKATFDLTLVHSANFTSLANTEPLYERLVPKTGPLAQLSGEQKLVKFARTPPISTYLLALVVGELDHIERTCNVGVGGGRQLRIRVQAPDGLSRLGGYALDTACGAYRLLEEYCAVELPLRKLDLVAVADFEAGAMENWGLVTFKDQQLLVDPVHTTPTARALVGGTVVHELAHHWFGNLVTLDWWNELWLNEGFATWFEHRIMDQLYPELEFQFHYLLDSHIHALNLDSFRSAHPIRPDAGAVLEPPEIDELFDAISYNKAAAIIRTLNDDYLEPEPFREALRRYLAGRKFSTSNSEQLCHFMEQQLAPKNQNLPPVCRYLNSWLLQAGHPLVALQIDTEKRRLVLSQQRFVTNVVDLTPEESGQRWIILVNLLLSDGGSPRKVMQVIVDGSSGTTNITLPDWFDSGPNSRHWLKMNANFSGFYRSIYPVNMFKKFRDPMRTRSMPAADRLNLVDETHTLVLANKYGAEHLIELFVWLRDENHGAVLDAAAGAYLALLRLFENSELPGLRQKLLDFGRTLFGSMLGRQLPAVYLDPAKSSNHMLEMGRAAVLNLLVQVNHELALSEAVQNFETTFSKRAPAPHLRGPFYTAVGRNGSEAQFGRLLARLDEIESRDELVRLTTALAKSEQQSRLARLWSWLRNSNKAASLDRLDMVSTMVQSGPIGRKFVRELLENSPNELVALNQDRPVTSLIEELCISSGSRQFSDLGGLFGRQKSLIDWHASSDYIKRLLDWQAKLQASSSKGLELALDSHLMELRRQQQKQRQQRQLQQLALRTTKRTIVPRSGAKMFPPASQQNQFHLNIMDSV